MNRDTSWTPVKQWYDDLVGSKGHFYHRTVVIPKTIELLQMGEQSSLLELGCGQGILGRSVYRNIRYVGVDISKELVELAKSKDKNDYHKYLVFDSTLQLRMYEEKFSHGAIVLAFQNMKNPQGAIKNMNNFLNPGGRLAIILNHPCFRIPKHSDWGVDRLKKTQYRKIENYMSRMEIPIDSSPYNHKDNKRTWSYHYPLTDIVGMLGKNGFLIEKIEEWVSPKKSEGPMAPMEDKARAEIPLFMGILAVKR